MYQTIKQKTNTINLSNLKVNMLGVITIVPSTQRTKYHFPNLNPVNIVDYISINLSVFDFAVD
jgi:hypothetical protein